MFIKNKIARSLIFTSIISISLCSNISSADSMSNFNIKNTYSNTLFADVPTNAWFYKDVKTSYELGLMEGQSASKFNPQGNITVAEMLALSARVHVVYTTGTPSIEMSGNNWYDGYIKYIKENNMGDFGSNTNFNRPATRAEVASIFSKILPDKELAQLNNIGSIPDVPTNAPYHNDVLKLYKAGVLRGTGAEGYLKPTTNISRAEVSAIINRISTPQSRLKFTLTPPKPQQPQINQTQDKTIRSGQGKTVYVSKINQYGQKVSYTPQPNYQKINTMFSNHTYGSNNQAEYDKVMNLVKETAERAKTGLNKVGGVESLPSYKSAQRYKSGHADATEMNWGKGGGYDYILNTTPELREQLVLASLTDAYLMGYNKNSTYITDGTGESAYTDLFGKGGDCNALAYTSMAVYDYFGFNTRIVSTTTHAWAEVEFNGKWYNLEGGVHLQTQTNTTVDIAPTFSTYR